MTVNQFGDQAIPCPQCGYDLRATALGGSCPECGLLVQAVRSGIRVDGRYLVVRSGAVLPARCIKTNELVEQAAVNKTFYWVNPAWLLLILASPLALLVVYLVVRKECHITFSMSRSERRKVWTRTTASLLVFGAAVAATIVGVAEAEVGLAVAGIVCLFPGLVMAIVFANPIGVAKAKNDEFWIKGCGRDFLDSIRAETSLVEWPAGQR